MRPLPICHLFISALHFWRLEGIKLRALSTLPLSKINRQCPAEAITWHSPVRKHCSTLLLMCALSPCSMAALSCSAFWSGLEVSCSLRLPGTCYRDTRPHSTGASAFCWAVHGSAVKSQSRLANAELCPWPFQVDPPWLLHRALYNLLIRTSQGCTCSQTTAPCMTAHHTISMGARSRDSTTATHCCTPVWKQGKKQIQYIWLCWVTRLSCALLSSCDAVMYPWTESLLQYKRMLQRSVCRWKGGKAAWSSEWRGAAVLTCSSAWCTWAAAVATWSSSSASSDSAVTLLICRAASSRLVSCPSRPYTVLAVRYTCGAKGDRGSDSCSVSTEVLHDTSELPSSLSHC